MSFDVNPLNTTPETPTFITAQAQEGGAGNTGYYERKKKREEQEEEEELKKALFEEKGDTFTLEDAQKSAYIETPPLLKIVNYFKNIFRRLLNR